MDDKKICNQVSKGLCNCNCVKNGTYHCFIEKEYLLNQQNLALKQKLKIAVEALEAISKAHSETVPRIMQYVQQALTKIGEVE